MPFRAYTPFSPTMIVTLSKDFEGVNALPGLYSIFTIALTFGIEWLVNSVSMPFRAYTPFSQGNIHVLILQ